MAQIIKTTGEIINVEPENGTDFSLKEMQSIVGGYIELVRLNDNMLMVVNEEGKIKHLPLNYKATQLVAPYDIICGDILICRENEIK